MALKEKNSMRIVAVLVLIAVLIGGAFLLFGRDAPSSDNAERAAALADAGFTDAQRKGIEAIVHDYLVANPEAITEALAELDRRQLRSRLDEAGAALQQPFEGAYMGAADGKVTLVEFTDYACGFCRRSVEDIDRLIEANPDLKVVFREAPILSQESRNAALWALAAAEQGRYEAFHRALFAAGPPSEPNILSAAQAAGMDIAAARQQIVQPKYAAELNANIEAMRTIGVGGTPTFVIGDEIIEGAVGFERLQDAIKDARG